MKTFALLLLVAATSLLQAAPLKEFPRTKDGHPDFSGVWQSITTAYWNLEPHVASEGGVSMLGALYAVPPGAGIVVGDRIPYKPEALKQRDDNFKERFAKDPESNCYMGGVPRSTYMPYPFQIFQSSNTIAMVYQYATGLRRVTVGGKEEAPLDSWMGWSNAHWEGDTLVIEVTGLNGQTWLDRAGNYTSSNVKVTERYKALSANHIEYEATIEDSTLFTQPWKIRLPLYRIVDDNYRLMEFKCEPFAEEKLFGHLRKK